MIGRGAVFLTLLLCAAQGSSLDGTWELARIFRTGPLAGTRAVPIDSTTYLRLTLASHPGDWLSGTIYRRYRGEPERSKLVGGAHGTTGRYALSAGFDHPIAQEAKTAAWLVGGGGDTLRLGTSFVPDADSLELRRVPPDAQYPATVVEVVSRP